MKQSTIIKILWLKLRKNRKNDFRLLRKWYFVCNKFANYANADRRTGQTKPQQSPLWRPALPNAYHAYLCQNSRRIRHLRRPSTENHTINETPSGSPLKGENPKSPFKGDLEGLFWAYLPNNLPKYVVPLQRNFKPQGYPLPTDHYPLTTNHCERCYTA